MKLKENELRIGNWVNEKHPFQVDTIYAGDGFDNPIPLTEEWLLKFGFENDEIDNVPYYFKGGFQICTYRDHSKYWLRRYYAQTQPELKYVHQLQNLYFALTGKELTINESTTSSTNK